MGRAALLICTGFTVILGIIRYDIHNRQISQTSLNVDYVNQSQARNMAMSGMEIGIREIMEDFGWRPDPEPWTITISGNTADVYIDDDETHPGELESNQVRVRTQSEIGGRQGNAHAILELGNIIPKIPGAMGFYTDKSKLNINGNAFEFNGNDTNPDGSSGDEAALPGVVADSIAYDDLLNNLNSNQKQTVEEGGYEQEDLDNEDLQEHIDKYVDVASPFDGSSVSPLGSPDNPKVTILDGAGEAKDEIGAGIFIIPEGTTFTAKGDFTFHGLIIVQGKLDLRGNVTVFGSMLFGGELLYGGESELEIPVNEEGEASFSGTVGVNYSSSALTNVNNKLAHLFGDGIKITSMYD